MRRAKIKKWVFNNLLKTNIILLSIVLLTNALLAVQRGDDFSEVMTNDLSGHASEESLIGTAGSYCDLLVVVCDDEELEVTSAPEPSLSVTV